MKVTIPCSSKKFTGVEHPDTVLERRRVKVEGHPRLKQEIETRRIYPRADISVCGVVAAQVLDEWPWLLGFHNKVLVVDDFYITIYEEAPKSFRTTLRYSWHYFNTFGVHWEAAP